MPLQLRVCHRTFDIFVFRHEIPAAPIRINSSTHKAAPTVLAQPLRGPAVNLCAQAHPTWHSAGQRLARLCRQLPVLDWHQDSLQLIAAAALLSRSRLRHLSILVLRILLQRIILTTSCSTVDCFVYTSTLAFHPSYTPTNCADCGNQRPTAQTTE